MYAQQVTSWTIKLQPNCRIISSENSTNRVPNWGNGNLQAWMHVLGFKEIRNPPVQTHLAGEVSNSSRVTCTVMTWVTCRVKWFNHAQKTLFEDWKLNVGKRMTEEEGHSNYNQFLQEFFHKKSKKVNRPSVVEVKQCSPWCNHPAAGLWCDSMHECSFVISRVPHTKLHNTCVYTHNSLPGSKATRIF